MEGRLTSSLRFASMDVFSTGVCTRTETFQTFDELRTGLRWSLDEASRFDEGLERPVFRQDAWYRTFAPPGADIPGYLYLLYPHKNLGQPENLLGVFTTLGEAAAWGGFLDATTCAHFAIDTKSPLLSKATFVVVRAKRLVQGKATHPRERFTVIRASNILSNVDESRRNLRPKKIVVPHVKFCPPVWPEEGMETLFVATINDRSRQDLVLMRDEEDTRRYLEESTFAGTQVCAISPSWLFDGVTIQNVKRVDPDDMFFSVVGQVYARLREARWKRVSNQPPYVCGDRAIAFGEVPTGRIIRHPKVDFGTPPMYVAVAANSEGQYTPPLAISTDLGTMADILEDVVRFADLGFTKYRPVAQKPLRPGVGPVKGKYRDERTMKIKQSINESVGGPIVVLALAAACEQMNLYAFRTYDENYHVVTRQGFDSVLSPSRIQSSLSDARVVGSGVTNEIIQMMRHASDVWSAGGRYRTPPLFQSQVTIQGKNLRIIAPQPQTLINMFPSNTPPPTIYPFAERSGWTIPLLSKRRARELWYPQGTTRDAEAEIEKFILPCKLNLSIRWSGSKTSSFPQRVSQHETPHQAPDVHRAGDEEHHSRKRPRV